MNAAAASIGAHLPFEAGRCQAVAIGASAGGVEALMSLLKTLPAGFPAAVFVVLHLPRARPSQLVDIFLRRCQLAVAEAQDKEPVAAGTVYFAPPDYHLLIDREADGSRCLALSADELVNYSRPSIDVLFQSAADAYARSLVGIVLTGGNNDGAEGLRAIQDNGGLAVVQNPATASSSAMPAAALARSPQARVLELDGIAALLRSMGTDADSSGPAPGPGG